MDDAVGKSKVTQRTKTTHNNKRKRILKKEAKNPPTNFSAKKLSLNLI
jgi:hypothetical protein